MRAPTIILLLTLLCSFAFAKEKPRNAISTPGEAILRADQFLRNVGWTADSPAVAAETPKGSNSWQVEYRKDEGACILRIDGPTGAVNIALSGGEEEDFEVDRELITDEEAISLADRYVRLAGGKVADTKILQNEIIRDPESNKVKFRLVSYGLTYQGYDVLGGQSIIKINPIDGSLIKIWVCDVRLLPKKMKLRIQEQKAKLIGANFLWKEAKIGIGVPTSAKLWIVPLTDPITGSTTNYRLAWVVNYISDVEGHRLNSEAWVDAENGKVLNIVRFK